MKIRFSTLMIRLLLGISMLTFVVPLRQQTVLANDLDGVIAYVLPNQPGGDEIYLIESNGSGSRLLFRTNIPIPENLTDILTLVWKPDASELAFASAHENTCSLYETDIYTIRPDGKNYRRVTDPPACGSRAGLPTGTVTVPIYNNTNTMGPFIIYFEGAPAATTITLASGHSMDVTFYNVVDYGSKAQDAVWMYGQFRSPDPGARVDVVPGAAVRTGELVITAGFKGWGFRWPTYLPGGAKIATILGESTLYEFETNDQALGWNGASTQFDLKLGGYYLTWGPTPALANKFLYVGSWQDSEWNWRDSVFLGDVNGSEGQEIFDIDPNQDGNVILGLAWLPDGSGFLYSYKEVINDQWDEGANIWEYSFATGKSTRLTDVPQGFTRQMAISPDGSKIVFEYHSSGDWMDANPPIDLWMMNRDGSGQTLFVENGRSPAWSPAPIPDFNPVPLPRSVYLPVVLH